MNAESHEVLVRFFAGLADVFGKEARPTLGPATDVAAVLGDLCDRAGRRRDLFRGDGGLQERIVVLVNGRNISFLDGLATTLEEGDVISIFPPVYGG